MRKLKQSIILGITALCVYTCMYAIRKPYTAFTFDGIFLWGLPIKAMFVMAQITGYALSKWFGIGLIGNMNRSNRLPLLILLLGSATAPLLFLSLLPPIGQVLCMLASGFPLGLVYGVVFSWIEGRRFTELLGAVLACTFVFSSGLVKSIALYLSDVTRWSEMEIPGIMALMALAVSLPFIYVLNRTDLPDEEDVKHRLERTAADKATRKSIFKGLGFPLVLWIIAYFMLTLIRDLRDNFGAEILKEQSNLNPGIFLSMETPASLLLLFMISLIGLIKRHDQAIQTINYISMAGLFMLIIATLSFLNGGLDTGLWLFLVGIGCYLGYILLNISLFDRVVSISGYAANAGFLLYIADAWGYLGSVAMTLVRYLFPGPESWTEWFGYTTILAGVLGLMAFIMAAFFAGEEISERQQMLTSKA
ncbi:MAG: hypothetical protein RL160_771 [Bacteroidota bacterium]